jgi:hypothetical protein
MSLNKFTSSAVTNQWMNIACHELKADNLETADIDISGDLIVHNTLYPTTVPLGGAISMMSGQFSGLGYAISPYVFLNSIPQTYTINATPQTVMGTTTTTLGSSSAFITIGNNCLYGFESIGILSASASTGVVIGIYFDGNLLTSITQDFPIGTVGYHKISGQFQAYNGWGTSGSDIAVVLQAEYQDNTTPAKENLYTTSKVVLGNTGFTQNLPVGFEIRISTAGIGFTYQRVIGNISCKFNDLTQN